MNSVRHSSKKGKRTLKVRGEKDRKSLVLGPLHPGEDGGERAIRSALRVIARIELKSFAEASDIVGFHGA